MSEGNKCCGENKSWKRLESAEAEVAISNGVVREVLAEQVLFGKKRKVEEDEQGRQGACRWREVYRMTQRS